MVDKADQSLFVNAAKLPPSKAHYVLWLDVMGVQSVMSRSLSISANFIFKFHSAALEAKQAGVDIFPVMDGLYAVAADQEPMKQFIRAVLERVAITFTSEKEERFRFVVRGGLAYGSIIRGADVGRDAAPSISANPTYAATLLLGMPVIQAHVGESQAPPFGVFVSESARGFAPGGTGPFVEVWWRWFESANHKLAVKLREGLEAYYDWCEAHALPILYDSARIQAHRTMARQFLPEK
jgi:hypothetical protein